MRAELEQKAKAALSEGHERVGRPAFTDVVTEAVVFPMGVTDQAEAERRVEAGAKQFFEETWLQRPLKALDGIPPIDAAGHAVLRRKLRGVIQFLADCAAGGALRTYDFDRLRRKLGLTGAAAPAAAGCRRDGRDRPGGAGTGRPEGGDAVRRAVAAGAANGAAARRARDRHPVRAGAGGAAGRPGRTPTATRTSRT